MNRYRFTVSLRQCYLPCTLFFGQSLAWFGLLSSFGLLIAPGQISAWAQEPLRPAASEAPQQSGTVNSPESLEYDSPKYDSQAYDSQAYDNAGAYSGQGRYPNDAADRKQPVLPDYDSSGVYRQPTCMLVQDNGHVLIATHSTGELYSLDLQSDEVRCVFGPSQFQFTNMLSTDSGRTSHSKRIVLADAAGEQLVVMALGQDGWHVQARLDVPGQPGDIYYDSSSKCLFATSLWGRRLHSWQVSHGPEFTTQPLAVVDLPMAGGQVVYLPRRQTVLVADGLGPGMAVVDWRTKQLVKHEVLWDHNITHLTASPDEKFITYSHQLLNEFIPSLQGDITWGGLISNNLRSLDVEQLLDATGDAIYAGSQFVPLGFAGQGGGDPTSFAEQVAGPDNSPRWVATLGGASLLAVKKLKGSGFHYISTGLHPVACGFSADASKLVVVNRFSDSVTVVDINSLEARHVFLGSTRRPNRVERGQQLFHDATLSHDGWMSCRSCHARGHTSGQLNDNLTDHSQGTPKRILSLRGQAETAPYSWLGEQASLESQIAHSIRSTMASDHAVDPQDVGDIAEFVRSLQPLPSLMAARFPKRLRADRPLDEAVQRGHKVFQAESCVDCHIPPLYTAADTFDVGLRDERGNRKFNPPSLLAVSQREEQLFHDGRIHSLREAFEVRQHQLSSPLAEQQLADLVAFLQSL